MNMTTGEKLAALRREAGLSQEALGEKLGLSRQAVSKWESDLAVPGMDNLVELARLYDISVDAILRPDENEPKQEPAVAPAEDTAASPKQKRRNGGKIAAAVLLTGCVLCSAALLMWSFHIERELELLRAQVNALPIGTHTIVTQEENPDMIDAAVTHTLDEGDPNRLRVSIHACPRTMDSEEQAQFSIAADGQVSTVDAAYVNGRYEAQTSVPLCDELSVLLLLTKGTETRTLAVETLFAVQEEYRLNLAFGGGFEFSQMAGAGTKVCGNALVEIDRGSSTSLYPVSGRVVVLVDGAEYDSVPISGMENSAAEWQENNGEALYGIGYPVELPWKNISANLEDVSLRIEITDNFGQTHTEDW